jgi:hypothetical protein
MASDLSIDDLQGPMRADILRIAASHKARQVAVFGSVARGDATATSDIDFLVEFEPGATLLDLLRLNDELERFLGRSVDVVSVGGLRPRDRHIRDEAVML